MQGRSFNVQCSYTAAYSEFHDVQKLLLIALASTWASPVFAYIGPGAGIGFFGSILTTIGMILLVILAVLLWPLRWAIRRMRANRGQQKPRSATTAPPPEQ